MRCITNCLHVSSAGWQIAYMVKQLNIAYSWNNSVIATKYIEYGTRYPFYHGTCWCIMNRRIVYVCSYKRLQTNRLHSKAAELELANSWNHCVTTTKYLEYIHSIHGTHYTLYTWVIKFYCDVITRSRLQLINTSIDTFFSELRAFLADQRRTRKANDG